MTRKQNHDNVGGFQFTEIGGSVTLEAAGDIVGGDKTVIQHIQNVYQLRVASRPISKVPYKFLAYYDIPDHDIFFGRDTVTETLLQLIARHKILIINGASGAGKSSVVNAGVIPKLAEIGYTYLRFRDYTDPLRQLQDYFASTPDLPVPKWQGALLRSVFSLARNQKCGPVVIVLDQFERFLLSVPERARDSFVLDLKTCLESDLTSQEINIIIVVRQEFLGKLLAELDEVIPSLSSESHTVHLRPLNAAEAKEAIVKPLVNVSQKIYFDQPFVDQVLLPQLVGQSPGEDKIEPAHLQIVCNSLYVAALEQLEEGAQGVAIGEGLYDELGKASGILQGYLNKVVDRVAGGDQDRVKLVRSILKLMIQSNGTRQFVTFEEIKKALPDVKDIEGTA